MPSQVTHIDSSLIFIFAPTADATRHAVMGDEGWSGGGFSEPPADGWGAADNVPTDGWGDAPAAPRAVPAAPARPPRPPRREEDDADAAKLVDGLATKVVAGKKKIGSLRATIEELDAKRQSIQADIDALMPELQQLRSQKSSALGQLAGARLPPMWNERAKDLNNRRRLLPGGCTTEVALNRMLKETEHEISHGSLSLKQEKAAMERLRELKKGRAVVVQYEADQAAVTTPRSPATPPTRHPTPILTTARASALSSSHEPTTHSLDAPRSGHAQPPPPPPRARDPVQRPPPPARPTDRPTYTHQHCSARPGPPVCPGRSHRSRSPIALSPRLLRSSTRRVSSSKTCRPS